MAIFSHTFWSKPAIESRHEAGTLRQLQTNIYCYALSYLYLHRLGHTVKLYADPGAQKLLSHIPYDEVITIEPKGSVKFWAQSKFFIYEMMEPGEIYLDGDVMIMSQRMIDIILESKADVIVQSMVSRDMTHADSYTIIRDQLKSIDYGPYFHPTDKEANSCNTGVTRINNPDLAKDYVSLYRDIMRRTEEGIDLTNLREGIPMDVLTEQQSLAELCKAKGYTIDTLFAESLGPYLKKTENEYRHLIGGHKYALLPLVKSRLEKLDPILFNAAKEQELKINLDDICS